MPLHAIVFMNRQLVDRIFTQTFDFLSVVYLNVVQCCVLLKQQPNEEVRVEGVEHFRGKVHCFCFVLE